MKDRSETRVPCSVQTREEYIKPQKRAGETYDELLRKMAKQYDPEQMEE